MGASLANLPVNIELYTQKKRFVCNGILAMYMNYDIISYESNVGWNKNVDGQLSLKSEIFMKYILYL